jgi:hypothetical protein
MPIHGYFAKRDDRKLTVPRADDGAPNESGMSFPFAARLKPCPDTMRPRGRAAVRALARSLGLWNCGKLIG